MSYLEIIERLEKTPDHRRATPAASECRHEINEINEISPPATPEPAVTGEELPGCGSPSCAGCYSVGESNRRERFIHPPKSSAEWLEWRAKWDLAKWRPPKGSRTQ
jgi:hypothetical protein